MKYDPTKSFYYYIICTPTQFFKSSQTKIYRKQIKKKFLISSQYFFYIESHFSLFVLRLNLPKRVLYQYYTLPFISYGDLLHNF